MPYDADLRCGYFRADLNMSWFYEAMKDFNEEIEFINDDAIKPFEEHINEAFNRWTVWTVFNFKRDDAIFADLKHYENIWDFLRDVATDYAKTNAFVEIISLEEE